MSDTGDRVSTAWRASPLWAALDVTGWWDALSGRERLLYSSLALVLALLVGALIIYMTDRWRRRSGPTTLCDANEQMASFRELYERGELSSDEFERIRAKLGGRLREEMDSRIAAEQPENPSPSEGSPPENRPPA